MLKTKVSSEQKIRMRRGDTCGGRDCFISDRERFPRATRVKKIGERTEFEFTGGDVDMFISSHISSQSG